MVEVDTGHTGFKRKLAAVLVADVVGYTRLMHVDEKGTYQSYLAHSSELLEPLVGEWHGRVIKHTGDGFIADFDSVVDAVECAIAIQDGMGERNRTVPEDQRLVFRIGINLGDIIAEKGDIYGDGVNIAARLEGLARPGGICVSGGVLDQITNKISVDADDLGPQRVKNIAGTIRAYHIRPGTSARRPKRPSIGGARRGRRILAAASVVALGLAAIFAWQYVGDTPRRIPTIAVLPFDDLGAKPADDYFVDGMTEDIITELSKISGLQVIARNSSFVYKGSSVNVSRVGRELGADYLLEGSIRKSGETLRVNAQLIEASSGTHLWAENYDRQLRDVFAVQDDITKRIVIALAVKLSATEASRINMAGTLNVAAYDAFLMGWAHYQKRTPDDVGQALFHFKRAVEIDPGFGRAHAALAATYLTGRTHNWISYLGLDSRYQAFTLARSHLAKAEEKPSALYYRVAAQLAYRARDFDEAISLAEKAIAMNPSDADSYARLGMTMVWNGSAKTGVIYLQRAMKLDPRYPPAFASQLGVAFYAAGDFMASAKWLEEAFRRNPTNHLPLVHLIAAYGQLGRKDAAAKVLRTLNELREEAGLSHYFLSLAERLMPYKLPDDLERLIEGLKMAGVR